MLFICELLFLFTKKYFPNFILYFIYNWLIYFKNYDIQSAYLIIACLNNR